MLSISSGHSAAYLTDQVAVGRESYYLDATTAGEPPGRWWGSGAALFGLSGEVDNGEMKALYSEFCDPRDPRWADPATRSQCDRLGQRPGQYKTAEQMYAERAAQEPDALPERLKEIQRECQRAERKSVMFIDATFSPAKSVTVLHTAFARAEIEAMRAGNLPEAARWSARRLAVEDAIWAGNNAMLEHLSDRAGFSRDRKHGAGEVRWVRARNWTVASFHQSDSRERDPQQHVHNAILNKVVCDDGQVRTLDSRGIHAWKQSAGAFGERVMEEKLSASLGLGWVIRADGTGREIAGITIEEMQLFSKRSTNLNKRLQAEVTAFTELLGREPSAIELDRLRRESSLATRKSKSPVGESHGERLERWAAECRAKIAGGLAGIAARFGHTAPAPAAEKFSPSGVIAEALAACQVSRAAFSRSELERQIILALPHLGIDDPAKITALVCALADRAMAESVQVTGEKVDPTQPAALIVEGNSVYAAPGGAKYATRQHIVAEQALRRAAVVCGRRAVSAAAAEAWLARGTHTLGADQAAAVKGLLTSGAAVSFVVGPAGTGKSYAVAQLAEAWSELAGGRLIGLATSEQATQNLVSDGVNAVNTRKWLNAQDRMRKGIAHGTDWELAIEEGDLIVLDEASMIDHVDFEKIEAYVTRAGARLIGTGDHRQLGAIGAGGTMAMLADVAETHYLSDVRRFRNTWEQGASLALRDGDLSAVDEYDRRGRLHDAGTVDNTIHAAARAYLGDILDGKSSLVFAATNRQAAAVSTVIRDHLVALGRVEADGVALGVPGDGMGEGTTAGVGDLVQAREIDRKIGVNNREMLTVAQVHPDGSLVVTRADGTYRTLPVDYVAKRLSLGYAGTVHAAQGATFDTGHAVVTSQFTLSALYVAMSRGRERNTAHVATQPEGVDAHTGETHERLRTTPVAVVQDILERESSSEQAATMQQAEEEARRAGMKFLHTRWEDVVRDITRDRLERHLNALTSEGILTEDERHTLAADQGTEQLSRLLRAVEQAGGDPYTALRAGITSHTLDGLRSLAQGIHARIAEAHAEQLAPVPGAAYMVPENIPSDWSRHLETLAAAADNRRRDLGVLTAEQAPQWAIEHLGPVPDDVIARTEWEHKAGLVAAYREAVGWEDEAEPMAPPHGLSATERRAAWHVAWTALGRPDAGSDELSMSDGALRIRVKAWQREKQWAPRYVDDEMRAVGRELEQHRQTAAILTAQAQAATDNAEREQLLTEAALVTARAERLATTEADLAVVAEQRAAWRAEAAITKDHGERAEVELVRRQKTIGDESDGVTLEEWLELEDQVTREEDQYRQITEADLMETELAEAMETKLTDTVESDMSDVAEDHHTPLPAGVPTQVEVDAALAEARVAADKIADRHAAEQAHRESVRAQRAEAERAAREAAWRETEAQAIEDADSSIGL